MIPEKKYNNQGMNSPGAPSNFRMKSKVVLVSVHNTFR